VKIYTMAQAATKLKISRQTLYSWIEAGHVTAPKVTIIGKKSFRLWTAADLKRVRKFKGTLKPGVHRRLLSRSEAAHLVSISVSTIDMLIATGRLRVRRQGRRVLVSQSDVERLFLCDLPVSWPPKENGKTVNAPGRSRIAKNRKH
jgi:excisionase family DNA binding protein